MHSILVEGHLSPHNLSSKLRSILTPDSDPETKKRIEIESRCFEFYFKNGTLVPQIERVDGAGNRFCYPDLEQFEESDWNYIEQRLDEEEHPFLCARYAHLLWLHTKHNNYAVKAISSYKNLVNLYFEDSKNNGQQLFHKQLEAVCCYHNLSLNIKFNLAECKNDLKAWLWHENLPFIYKCRIVDVITGSSLFKQSDYQGLTEYLLGCFHKEETSFSVVKNSLESLLVLAQKEGRSSKEIFMLMGENELNQADSRKEDQTGMIPLGCYQRAADYFKRAGAQDKFQEAAKLYSAQKHKVKLATISTELSDENTERYNNFLNEVVDDLLSGDVYRPFWFLATEDRILLPKEISGEEVMEGRKNSIMDLFTVQTFDQNNNTKTLTEAEKIKHHQFQHYSFMLQVMALVLMEKLFFKGFRMGKITIPNIMRFFNNTWLAQALNGYNVDGEPSLFSWIELIGPGLYNLINELHAESVDKNYKPDYTLAIDSLSIKMEGIIRDFASISGLPTSKIKEDEVQEMNLEELLNNDNVQGLFSKDDVLLWRSMLTKKGYNVRNNTAHGFYRPNNYTRQKALFILLCIFRISGYRIMNMEVD